MTRDRAGAKEGQRDVAGGAGRGVAGGGHAGHAVGEGDHASGDGAALCLVVVEASGGDRVSQGVAVLDAGVHSLAARGAVDMGGVAGQEQPAVAVAVGDAVVHAEP